MVDDIKIGYCPKVCINCGETYNVYRPLSCRCFEPRKSEYKQLQESLKKIEKWDKRFLELAKLVSTWSLDPSTKTGAVIVDKNNRVLGVGYNGLPRDIKDTSERLDNRELKYKIIIHCEENAAMFANQSLEGATLYTYPFMSCSHCASRMIQLGIKRIVAPEAAKDKLERWGADFKLSEELFVEANVQMTLYADFK